MHNLTHLLVNGCSFLTPRHTPEIDLEISTANVVKEHGKFDNFKNFARGGRGNDRIMMTTITYFEKFPERKKDTFVLIGWSTALRMDYPTRKDFKPMPPLDECWATIKMARHATSFDKMAAMKMGGINHFNWEVQRWYQNTIGLQSYLKTNNIRYVMYNSLKPAIESGRKDHYELKKAVDQNKFMEIDYCQNDYCQQTNQYISTNDHHPNEDGHRNWGKKVTNFIDKNNLYEV
tara:strand:- start:350 stop:1048 length:699 start_codon:yes stop_codon:yes gene_type:complete